MELVRLTPHGSVFTYQSMFRLTYPLAAIMIALGQHTRAGIEENLWDTTPGKRATTIQMIEKNVRIANELGRKIATADEAREILKIGTWYDSPEETLLKLGLPPNREGQTGFVGYTTKGGKVMAARAGGSDGHPMVGHE